MRTAVSVRLVLISFVLLALSYGASAQVSVGISVNFGPPALPVYEQPICPAEGYLWTPGYWAYDDADGYFWVPGTWVLAPQVGFLWTPGYWGWGGNAFFFHEGYWGPQVGFYGGINYGFGYGGVGYEGGRWEGGRFSYNTYVNRVNTTIIHNTYNTTVTNISVTHVSYNGGTGGVEARPTSQEQSYANEHHVAPVAAQTQHVQEARGNPELRASANQGKPPIAATAKPADFKTGVVASKQAGGEYKAPPANAARGTEVRSGAENHPENNSGSNPATNNHAGELQPHTFTPPNSGNTTTDKKYQQQQDKLAAKQSQDHQKLQQQQEQEHQQATQKNYSDAQKQQMEQQHTQQTQQLEQKHATQQQQMEQHQAPHQSAPKPASAPPAEKPH